MKGINFMVNTKHQTFYVACIINNFVFSVSSQREPALQRRLPGDQQEPQVSETQQRCGREGSAGWRGQQDQQGQWQGEQDR